MANRFNQKYSINDMKFVRQLSLDNFIDYFQDENREFTEDGDRIYWDVVYKRTKGLANELIKKDVTERRVNYLTKLPCDRIYEQSFGLQSMPRRLRAFLARANYCDIDIVNSGPNVLYYIATDILDIDPAKITTLKDYATNPKKIRGKYGLVKNDMFSFYFNEGCKGRNDWTRQFAKECKLLQDVMWEQQIGHDIDYYDEKKKNKKGAYCSAVYFKYERSFLDRAIDMVKQKNVGSPIHDGFLLDRHSKDIPVCLEVINDEMPTNINFIHKPFPDDYPALKEAYENFEEEDTQDHISFIDIDDEWFVEQFFNHYKGIYRVDDDDNLFVFKDIMWELDLKKKTIYQNAVELVRTLKKDAGYSYMSESDAKAFKKYNNHNTVNALSNKLKNLMSVYVDEMTQEYGKLLFFKNGYYDLETKQFHDKFDKCNTWAYDFNYDSSRNPDDDDEFEFDDIIKDCTGSNYDLFVMFLLAALNGISIKKMLYLIGVGNNGKSVLVDTLRIAFKEISHKVEGDIFGYDLSVNKPRADLLGLQNKRMIWSSEPSEANLKAPTIKALTGGDSITCRKLHSNDTIEFKSNFLFMVASNNPVNLEGVDNAVLNRFLFMEMKSKFVSNPRADVPEEKQADPEYLTERFQKSQREHIVHWLIKKHETNKEDFMTFEWTTPETEILRTDMKENTSEAILFIETNTIDCIGEEVPLGDLFKRFKMENPNSFLTKNKFNRDIRSIYTTTKGTRDPNKNKPIIKNRKLLEIDFDNSNDLSETDIEEVN